MTIRTESRYELTKPIKRVAIIGAGAAGLATAHALNEEAEAWELTIFEKTSGVGGTWHYEDIPDSIHLPSIKPLGENSKSLHQGSIYESLHTNIPTPVMSFKDFPFPEGTPLFPSHGVVLQYLKDFAENRFILPSIKFNSEVLEVNWDQDKWKCTYAQQEEGVKKEDFDAVVICNGHYTVPYIPNLSGLKDLIAGASDRVIHSRQYKKPYDYVDLSVLVVGGGYSALEITREISFYANKVYHSITAKGRPVDTRDGSGVDPSKIKTVAKITKFDNQTNSVHFDDGTVLDVIPDRIIFATGYLYSFPFMSQFHSDNQLSNDKILSDGFSVHNIYEQIFYIPNPTLAFVGLPNKVAPFPLFQYQAAWISKVFSRKVSLPSEEEMLRNYQQELAEWEGKKFHVFRTREIEYCNRISDYTHGAISPIPGWWAEMRPKAHQMRVLERGH